MEYHNRQPPEGINTPQRHPLKEFFRLLFFAVIALVAIGLLLNYSGGQLGGLLPYKVENWLAEKIHASMLEAGQESPFQSDEIDGPLREYLNELSSEVQAALGFEDPMVISLHYSEEDTVNAYATIAGHVYLFKGLLKQLPHENALVMLMAHEFSHVQLRHTAKGIGSGLAVAIGTSVLPVDTNVNGSFFGLANQLTSMRFSRGMETEADLNGLVAVEKLYGHIGGAGDLFELFMLQRDNKSISGWDTFFSTHPLDQDRIDALMAVAGEKNWALSGEVTPLPKNFGPWLTR